MPSENVLLHMSDIPVLSLNTLTMENLPEDHILNLMAFTKTNDREVYPAIDPTSPSLSQASKAIIITGASRGEVRPLFSLPFPPHTPA